MPTNDKHKLIPIGDFNICVNISHRNQCDLKQLSAWLSYGQNVQHQGNSNSLLMINHIRNSVQDN